MRSALRFLLFVWCILQGFSCGAVISFAGKDSRLRIKNPNARLVLRSAIENFQGVLEISDNALSQLQGLPIVFAEGTIEKNGVSAQWSGQFNTAAIGGQLVLSGASQMRAQPGMSFVGLVVSGQDNLIEGTPRFLDPIVIQDQASELKFSIQNKLNHDVYLNGGRVVLEDTLSIGDDCMLCGDGIVDINSHTLQFPGKSSIWGGNLYFLSATDMTLNAALTLTGMWYFGPDNSVAVLQGNGNVLDLSLGGSLVVQAGVGLGITDVVIKGLSEIQGTIVMCDSNSTLSLSNTVLQLNGNYTFTQGNLYFYGANSMIVTGTNKLTVAVGAIATIDATTLEYDTLSFPDLKPITPASPDGAQLIALNGGRLMLRPSGLTYGSKFYVDNSVYIQRQNEGFSVPDRVLNFRGANASNITWDGGGYTMQFARGDAQAGSISVAAGKTVTLQNIVLKDFNSQAVTLLSNASIVFGNNVTIELGDNEDLSYTWSFTGREGVSTIRGNGRNLSFAGLGGSNKVGIMLGTGAVGQSVTVNLQDLHVMGLSGGVTPDVITGLYDSTNSYVASSNLIRCADHSGVINLRNTHLNLSGNYTLSAGSINIYNDVYLKGKGYTFAFSSNGTMAIQSASTLFVDRNVTFSYDSSGFCTPGPVAPSKTQLTFANQTSRLYLSGCTLYATMTAPRLQTGVVVIDDKVTVVAEGAVRAEALVFDTTSGLYVELLAGGMMDVYGAIAYS
ncbi:hypothetical protein FJ366_01800 [Candidatus Dependentiae bacterium]|nr:hypothetical protein [Candidatus Dependentiae bacterium]